MFAFLDFIENEGSDTDDAEKKRGEDHKREDGGV
jgi:hypothetical protein